MSCCKKSNMRKYNCILVSYGSDENVSGLLVIAKLKHANLALPRMHT